MSVLDPQPLEVLLARARAELAREGRVFDLPRRSFWRADPDLDLSVVLHGRRATSPVGPAAGPHTQLAQNLVIGWLAGARVFELKTVQVQDRITVPRPCIDAAAAGFNVEWSQELSLEETLEQYVSGWMLIHALSALETTGARDAAVVFECSVGYDLAGIRSERVARFLDRMRDATPVMDGLRDRMGAALRREMPCEAPSRVAAAVTLSTMHGCRPEEIERIVEHVFDRHGMDVTLKLNPTLLGREAVEHLLRERLGHHDIVPDPAAFEHDLRFDEGLPLLERLHAAAARRGLEFGVKLTNTLPVRNPGTALAGEVVYLSGRPLHPIAIALAARLAEAIRGRLPMAFSAGLDADNVAEVVACGFAPATTCTDLLAPTGYRRLPRYMHALASALREAGASDLPGYVLARASAPSTTGAPIEDRGAPAIDPTRSAKPDDARALRADAVHQAARRRLAAYARTVLEDPRYHAAHLPAPPARVPSRLALLDCASCNACLVVCPNDAVFAVATPPGQVDAPDLVVIAGGVVERPGGLAITRPKQWAVFAGFCNLCGNCETFCPEQGGPQHAKAHVHGSRVALAASTADGVALEEDGRRIVARLGGQWIVVDELDAGVQVNDGVIMATLDRSGQVSAARAVRADDGHVLSLADVQALRALRDGIMAGIHPVMAPQLLAAWRAEGPGAQAPGPSSTPSFSPRLRAAR